jgi:hypothetical protein
MAMLVNPEDRKRDVRRAAWWLALLALLFYVGFIALGVVQGG